MEQITQEQLKRIFHYNKDTGIFKWKISPKHSAIKAGDKAGLKNSLYPMITIHGNVYPAHNLAWLYIHGKMPNGVIDHQNRIKHDNRIINLLDVTEKQNNRNKPMLCTNISGFTGVNWEKTRSKWRATITIDGKTIHLGRYSDKKLAIKAREKANIKYGFHPNHGKDII